MHIPSSTFATTSTSVAAKSPQSAAKAASFKAIQSSQGVPGMSTDQLNSMLHTSLKMQSIRNDASIPEEVKKRLLLPLEQANRDALAVADAKAEQEEKSKIIEASSEDAEAIRTAGEEIAASAETVGVPPVAPPNADGTTGVTEAATIDATTQPLAPVSLPKPEARSAIYSTSPSASAVSESVDVVA